ncbi:MAG: RDD family protein [Myxococcales bacterium]|jgi:uncharacterized RDD family membrane protein YckC
MTAPASPAAEPRPPTPPAPAKPAVAEVSEARAKSPSPAPSAPLPRRRTPAYGSPAQAPDKQAVTAAATSSAVYDVSKKPLPSAESLVVEIHAAPGKIISRLAAWMIDAAFLGALFVALLLVAQAIAGSPLPASRATGIDWIVERAVAARALALPGAALLAALAFVYSSLFHALGGRTLGKWLFGLVVVDESGQPPRLAVSAARSLLGFVSAALLMMGFAIALFSRRRQALHDKLTRTFVVHLLEGRGRT